MNNQQTIEEYDNFEDMGLSDAILRGIYGYGFENPSTIQSKAIVPIIKGNDVIAQSQSGTGKTGAFLISTLQRIDENLNECQAIIMGHTKELTTQIHNVCKELGNYTKITPVLCIGKTDIFEAKKSINKGPTIAIGTPGRILDMIRRRYLSTKYVKIFVLDEADEMLSPGFQNEIRTIIEEIPQSTQICIFSATLPVYVLELTEKFMPEAIRIIVKNEELTLEGIRQFYINAEREAQKFDIFCDIYDTISITQSMVYVNTKRKADLLKENLERMNFTISVIHSGLTQTERNQIMRDYREGKTRILISTDLLSRGIDIQQVSVVINYDLPNNKECYLHRIGRSGRFGRKGVAINLVSNRDWRKLKELERFYVTQIEEMPANFSELI